MSGLLGLGTAGNWSVEITDESKVGSFDESWGMVIDHPSFSIQIKLSNPSVAAEMLTFFNDRRAERQEVIIGPFLGGQLTVGVLDGRLRFKVLGLEPISGETITELCEILLDESELSHFAKALNDAMREV